MRGYDYLLARHYILKIEDNFKTKEKIKLFFN